MDAAHLTRCVAQHGGTTAGSGAETGPQFPIDHESLQRDQPAPSNHLGA